MNERLIHIIEDYLAARTNGNPIPSEEIQRRVKNTRVPEDEIDHILLEMEDEWDREERNQFALKKAIKKLYIGTIGSLCIFIVLITSILLHFYPDRIIIVPFGLMAYGFITSFQGYSQIKKSKMVKERREIKWRIYDKYQRD